MKRLDITKLRKNRSVFLRLGFILSLSFTILAFNWTSYPYHGKYSTAHQEDLYIDAEVVRTVQEKKRQLPPPAVKPSEVISELNEPEFTNLPDPPKLETNISNTSLQEMESAIYHTEAPLPAPPTIREEVEENVPEIFKIVEEMPRFGDCSDAGMSKEERRMCSDRAILQYFGKSIRYPAIARENGIQGIVVVQFVVDENGQISEESIIKDIGGGCGAEAIRVLKEMPDWIPGQQRGRKVKVQMKLPIRFRLSNE